MPLVTGDANANSLAGGAADDTLLGLGGDDTLSGNGGRDSLDGGAGFDTVDFSGEVSDLDVDLAAGVERGVTNSVLVSVEGVIGAGGDDALAGNGAANRLDGRGGDDSIDGGAGDDTLVGGLGGDVIDGGAGYDTAAMGAVGFRGAAPAAAAGGTVFATDAAGTDFLVRVEIATFADGRLVMDADAAAARVARLYEAALDRLPDQGGLNFWIASAQDGHPLSALAAGFAGSGEFVARFGAAASDNGAYVDRLYQNVLGRAGEAEGRAFWVASLNGGASRADVLVAFSESAENKAGTASLVQGGLWDRSEEAAEVARLYDTVLGRRPEASGLVFWKDALEGGRATIDQVADDFARSQEFRDTYGAATTNRQFAEALYRNALDRGPEQSGLDYWTGRLDAGVARLEVVLAFSESAEHIALTAGDVQSEVPSEFGILFA
jgi:hypothetical protein